MLVPINNVGGAEDTETSTQHIAQRIFRRERGHWIGRLHEQIWARPGQPSMRYVTEDYVELVHVGYRSDLTEQRHKTDRNLRIASVEFDELAADTPDNRRAEVLVNLGRSLNWSGRDEEALTRFEEARGLAQTIQIKTTALRSGTESLLSLGRATEALEWATELEGIVSNTDFARYLKAQAHLNLGDPDAAIACLDGITELRTAEGVAYSGGLLPLNRSLAFAAAERWPEAADALLDIPDLGSIKEAIWKPLVEAQAKAGRSLDAVAAAVPEHRLLHVAAQVIAGRAELADQLAEALWARFPDDAQVLGFGARVAPALGVARALEWSARLRAAFAERYCPLVRIASDPHRSGTDRVLAAAVASVTFAEPQARDLIRHAATAVPVETFTTMLIELDQLAPTLLDAFILGAIATRDRAEAMAQALRSLGAAEQADAVLAPLGETASAGADA